MTGSRHEIPRITNTKLHKNYFIRGCSCYYSWLLVFLLAISIFPLIAEAQGLILKSLKTTYNAGDSFSVSLSLDTKGQSVNTLSGKIQVPTSNLQILDVRYGSSIISLWVERPKIDSSGNITFVGGIPGGFSGSNGPILTFGVRAKSEGQAAINIKDIKILLNDGKGTELAGATSGILKLIISKALPKPAQEEEPKEAYIPPPDTVPPESFIPLVSSHPTIGDNKYFVSFFAVDKDSGVAKYEIVESPLILSLFTKRFDASPLTAETPYILKGQFWAYKITVRAYDQAGNFTDSFVIKPLSAKVVVALVLLLLIASIFITYKLARPPRRHTRKMA